MKKIALLLIITISQFSFGQANKIYKKAIKSENPKEKIQLLTQVLKLEPKNLDAYFQRAITKNDIGDYHGAIVDYSKIIVEKPDADTYFNRGNSRYSLEDFQSAKEDYKKAFETDPNFIDALYSLGCVKYDLEDYEAALIDFNKVIKIEPYHFDAYRLRADTYVKLKENKKALKNYSIAIFLNPSVDSYYNRGVFYMDIKYYKKAKADLSTVIRLNKNNGFAYFYRGASNLLLEKHKNAITDFYTALKYDSLDFDAILGLAMAYLKKEDLSKAKSYFDRAKSILQINTNSNSSIDLFVNTYWYQHDFSFFSNLFNELEKL